MRFYFIAFVFVFAALFITLDAILYQEGASRFMVILVALIDSVSAFGACFAVSCAKRFSRDAESYSKYTFYTVR